MPIRVNYLKTSTINCPWKPTTGRSGSTAPGAAPGAAEVPAAVGWTGFGVDARVNPEARCLELAFADE